ncbi:MAG: sigma 54-interacting transcriptional regulator [Isosphaeraceae bacterium]|nr:sigma 54-interacting transcriptional regulator [Isosphaeraceae bacterium]
MPWIPHVMILDDETRVLESLVPSLVDDLTRALDARGPLARALRLGTDPDRGWSIAVSAHGFSSARLADFRHRRPHHLRIHLVREVGGRFDLARRLLNEQLFGVVVSDLRFSDEAGGRQAGRLFVDEVNRVHPDTEGILYSAYPKPEGFPAERFLRKPSTSSDPPALALAIADGLSRYLAHPAVSAFARTIGELGIDYESESFGTVLARLFDLARLFSPDPAAIEDRRASPRLRRPLPCVLLDGESGTGKRALAELFHSASERRSEPLVVASCSDLTNETLLRSTLFGHKRGAFTDARDDRPGLVASARRGSILLDDFHRLPAGGSAILHSFLEDGEYSRLGEEEIRRRCDAAAILTVESGPWSEKRRSRELPLSFLARVERLPLSIPPLRDRPEDIEAQAVAITRRVAREFGIEIGLSGDAIELLRGCPFEESNSRELRNVIERAVVRHMREVDLLEARHIEPFTSPRSRPFAERRLDSPVASPSPRHANEWSIRVRTLARRILAKSTRIDEDRARTLIDELFDQRLPEIWDRSERARENAGASSPIPWPIWEDLWRCYAVARLGGPIPAERVLGIPANTLRQWIGDREAKTQPSSDSGLLGD